MLDRTGASPAIHGNVPRIAILSILLMLIISASACGDEQETGAAGESISPHFDETVESGSNSIVVTALIQGAAPGGEIAEPSLIVASTTDERATLAERLGSADRPALKEVDLSSHIVIAAFLGVQPTSGYAIEIQTITTRDQILEMSVHTQTPAPGQPVRQGFETPYHIVQLDRESVELERLTNYRIVDEGGTLIADGPIDNER